jgi:uncharacterized membrane protein YciS (DUF1049 family)
MYIFMMVLLFIVGVFCGGLLMLLLLWHKSKCEQRQLNKSLKELLEYTKKHPVSTDIKEIPLDQIINSQGKSN